MPHHSSGVGGALVVKGVVMSSLNDFRHDVKQELESRFKCDAINSDAVVWQYEKIVSDGYEEKDLVEAVADVLAHKEGWL